MIPHGGDAPDKNATAPSALDAPSTEGGTPPRALGLSPALGVVHGVILGGRYRLLRFLARGGMGEVYEALDIELGVKLALKTIRPGLDVRPLDLRRFKREVLLARSVSHANVCRIYDLGVDRGEGRELLFLTMEFLAGETLGDRIKERGRMSAEEALPLVLQMTEALEAAHRAGIVHRDFKSANVMLVPGAKGERVVVTDFGLARAAADSNEEATGISSDGMVVGTPEYMAPEQVRGEPAGPRADLYALGVVLFEMMTATRPFRGDTRMATAMQRLERDPPSPRSLAPDLDPRWEDVILRCLAREPEKRFARAGDVAAALRGDGTAAIPVRRHELPAERDAFIGRATELDEVARWLSQGTRLLSVLGPGGMGKTRLSLRFGATAGGRFPGGVWFCDLSQARSLDGIVSAVASSLGVPLGGEDPVVQLGHAIAGRRQCLVILDNFEQISEHAAATIGRWLDRATEASFLVTSRARLALPGEVELRLESLPVVREGVELFEVRARAQRPGFAVTALNRDVIAQIVGLVDGLPLAVELAAARMRVLNEVQILDRLGDRFKLLAGGSSTSARQRTLRAAIDWSWDLLTPWEQAAWAQMSVFEGGFTLEAAEAVVDLSAWPEAPSVLDVTQSLLDRSLIRRLLPSTGDAMLDEFRFGMYVSAREYAREKLAAERESQMAVNLRHGLYYACFGREDALQALHRHGGMIRLKRLGQDIDNLVAACHSSVGKGDGGAALATYRAACEVFEHRCLYAAGAELGAVVAAMPGLAPCERGLLAVTRGRNARLAGRYEEALGHYEIAVGLLRGEGDQGSFGGALAELGCTLGELGRGEETLAVLEECQRFAREHGDRWLEGVVHGHVAAQRQRENRLEEGRKSYALAIALLHDVGDPRRESVIRSNLSVLLLRLGEVEASRLQVEAALSLARSIGHRRSEALALANLANLYAGFGQTLQALQHLRDALSVFRELGLRAQEGTAIGNIGRLHHEQAEFADAWSAYEAALAIAQEVQDRQIEVVMLDNMGELRMEQGRFAEARLLYDAALGPLRDHTDRMLESIVLVDYAMLHLLEGQLVEAAETVARAEHLLLASGDRVNLGKVLCVRARIEESRGDHVRACATLAEAEALAAELGAGAESDLGRKLTAARRHIGGSR